MKWLRALLMNERGVYLTMAAVLLPVCLLAAAVFADVGMLYVTKSHYQNAADAAALAGARELPDHAAAKEAVARYLAKNNVNLKQPGDLSVTYSDDGETYSETQGESYCRVIYSAPAQSLVMEALRGEASKIRVRAAAKKEGGNQYMVFANRSVSDPNNTTLTFQLNNPKKEISGKVHSNGGLTLKASPESGLNLIGEDNFTASGGKAGNGASKVSAGVGKKPMPSFDAEVEKYKNSGSRVYKSSTYNDQVYAPGTAYDAIIYTGQQINILPYGQDIGSKKHPVFIYSTGNVNISSSAFEKVYATVYAPYGTANISLANTSFYGSVVGDVVNIQVNSMEFDGDGNGGEKLRLVE